VLVDALDVGVVDDVLAADVLVEVAVGAVVVEEAVEAVVLLVGTAVAVEVLVTLTTMVLVAALVVLVLLMLYGLTTMRSIPLSVKGLGHSKTTKRRTIAVICRAGCKRVSRGTFGSILG
jgi:hypothetical protein